MCRVIFHDLAELGYLRDDCLFKTIEGKNGPLPAFDLFAKIGEAGHRSLTIINMDDGIYLKIIAKNGEKISRGAYLQQLPLRQILAQAAAARMASQQDSPDDDSAPASC